MNLHEAAGEMLSNGMPCMASGSLKSDGGAVGNYTAGVEHHGCRLNLSEGFCGLAGSAYITAAGC